MKVKEQLWVEEDENMALCPPVTATFEGLSEGPHVAICDMVVDLGMQETFYGLKHQIYIRFQVPTERIEYKDESGKDCEGPRVIGKFYGFNLGEKSILRKDLEAWRGKVFADSELMDDSGNSIYDVGRIVGKPCQVGVIKDDKGKSKIATIMGLPKSFPAPMLDGELVVYDVDSPGNLSKLPEWLRTMVGKAVTEDNSASAEHANQSVPMNTQSQPPTLDEFSDDVPF